MIFTPERQEPDFYMSLQNKFKLQGFFMSDFLYLFIDLKALFYFLLIVGE